MMTQQEQLVLLTISQLIDSQLPVTTLDVKNKLRVDFPTQLWVQNEVSKWMDGFARAGILEYTDNGTYREYRLPASAPFHHTTPTPTKSSTAPASGSVKIIGNVQSQPVTKKASTGQFKAPSGRISKFNPVNAHTVSMTKALDMIKNSKGHFITVMFKDKDNNDRVLNGQYLADQTSSPFGYVKMKELSKLKSTPNDAIRNVNIQTLQFLKVSGEYYKVDRH